MYDVLEPKLVHDPNLAQPITAYGGVAAYKQGIATMLETHIFKCPPRTLNTNNIVISAGCTSLNEAMSFALCDEDDWIIIPSPLYSGFIQDARMRSRVKVVPASMVEHCDDGSVKFTLATGPLEEVYQQAQTQGAVVKALMLCSPNNPTGTVFSKDQLLATIEWCRQKKVHLVSDEIYALSTFDQEMPFTSVYELCQGDLGDNIHIISSFSKDFCLNGYRAGYLYSQNTKLITYITKASMYFSCPNPVQSTLANILNDTTFLANYIDLNKSRLRSAYNYASLLFKEHDEMALWEKMLDARVVVTPGQFSLNDQPGFFRFIFTHRPPIIKIGIERIAKVYKECLLEQHN
eukprot:gene4228-4930_t